ncbi:hypothetical protein [Methylocella sp.]|uniref:hypothetical protein n=1 Tax=Methylocella sp. TaxID=1978226 RepID=UPI003782FD83
MACDKIMLIRHAERPTPDKAFRGVDASGRKDRESLTVPGWRRAGALARHFAPRDGRHLEEGLATPARLYACKADAKDPSLRPQLTLAPLADLLGLKINCEFYSGEEAALVADALRGEGPALISWKHDGMTAIADLILGESRTAPRGWPYGRYDMTWIFARRGAGWSFSQAPQLLLAGDSGDPIV